MVNRIDRHDLVSAVLKECRLLDSGIRLFPSDDEFLIPVRERCLQQISFLIDETEVHSPTVNADGADIRILQDRLFDFSYDSIPVPDQPAVLSLNFMVHPHHFLRTELSVFQKTDNSADGSGPHIESKYLLHLPFSKSFSPIVSCPESILSFEIFDVLLILL